MKILSLTQPWASLMAIGAKRFETRSWGTKYRGDVAIHAAKGFPADAQALCEREPFMSALSHARAIYLPRGVIVCVVELIAIVWSRQSLSADDALYFLGPGGDKIDGAPHETAFGDYSLGRMIWLTRNLRRLRRSVAAKGAQGLRTLDPAVEAQVRAEIE